MNEWMNKKRINNESMEERKKERIVSIKNESKWKKPKEWKNKRIKQRMKGMKEKNKQTK